MESDRINVYYQPKDKPVCIQDIVYTEDYRKLVNEIADDDKLTGSQKNVLMLLASRFLIFRYEKIADYYTQTEPHMQEWLEKLRCVIVDKDKAIQNGYIKFMQEYDDLIKECVDEK